MQRRGCWTATRCVRASCYAQLRLSEALAARQGDRFVVRFYSPLETVGGGVILDEHPYRHKRNDARVIASLAVRESGSDEAKLVQAVGERGADGMTLADLAACFDEPEEKLVEMLAVLCARGKARRDRAVALSYIVDAGQAVDRL